jgi:hypothetical protein
MGELAVGAAADLVLVEGDPLEDIGVLANSSNVKLVIKQGLLAKVGTKLMQCLVQCFEERDSSFCSCHGPELADLHSQLLLALIRYPSCRTLCCATIRRRE